MKKITSEQAQSIIDIACSGWKPRLAKNWAFDIALKNNIEITEESYQEMRKACTEEQNELFDKIFGKEELEYKVGDWVHIGKETGYWDSIVQITNITKDGSNKVPWAISKDGYEEKFAYRCITRKATPEEIEKAQYYPDGTPCLVRHNNNEWWYFRYADGKGRFYVNGKKSGEVRYWIEHMKLDMNNLPVNQ